MRVYVERDLFFDSLNGLSMVCSSSQMQCPALDTPMNLKPLLNQRAFITGGSKGIGNAIANKISSLGCKVTILSRNQELLERQVDQLNKRYPLANGELHNFVKFDLNDVQSIERFMKGNESFNNSNILINCAGVTQNKLLMSTPSEEIFSIINVNLTSAIILSKLFIKNISRIKNDSGCNANIINVSSVVSLYEHNLVGASVYSASKAALTRFTQTLAAEQVQIHKKRPKLPLVRVNALLPRHVSDTDIGKTVQSSHDLKSTTSSDVAHAAYVLLCDTLQSGAAVEC